MQGSYAAPNTATTEEVSPLKPSVLRTNQSAVQKTCAPTLSDDAKGWIVNNVKIHSRKDVGEVLQCQHCDYTTVYSTLFKIHCSKHTRDMLQCQHCDYTIFLSRY